MRSPARHPHFPARASGLEGRPRARARDPDPRGGSSCRARGTRPRSTAPGRSPCRPLPSLRARPPVPETNWPQAWNRPARSEPRPGRKRDPARRPVCTEPGRRGRRSHRSALAVPVDLVASEVRLVRREIAGRPLGELLFLSLPERHAEGLGDARGDVRLDLEDVAGGRVEGLLPFQRRRPGVPDFDELGADLHAALRARLLPAHGRAQEVPCVELAGDLLGCLAWSSCRGSSCRGR